MNVSVNELSSSGGSAGRFRFFGGVRRFGTAGAEIVEVQRRSGEWKIGRKRSRIDISMILVGDKRGSANLIHFRSGAAIEFDEILSRCI